MIIKSIPPELRDQPVQAASQAAPRPSLSEINAAIEGLRIYALGWEDYRALLDRTPPTRRAPSARRLTLRRRRRLIAAHRMPVWWDAVMTEPDHARDLLLMVLFTGMRQSKVMSLRWDCVDLVGRALYIPQAPSGPWLSIPMSDFLAELVDQRRAIVGWSDWVFPGRGRSGHIADTTSMVRRVAGRSAVPFALQDLRRTFLAIAESLDLPLYVVKRLLGHRIGDVATGYSGYVIVDLERLRDPVQRIADRILRLSKAHEQRGPFGGEPMGQSICRQVSA